MGPTNSGYGYYGEQKKKFPIKLVAVIAVMVIIVVILIGVIGAALGSNGLGTQAQHLSARLTNLSAVTAGAATQLHNGDLKKINAETALVTTGAGADLASILPKNVDKSITAAEADTTDTTSLSNAALNGTYDTVYKQVLQQQLQSVSALLVEMIGKAKSAPLSQTLTQDNANYQALLTSLSKISLQ